MDAIKAWADNGRPCGGFLTAVFENKLSEAVSRADFENMRAIPAIVAYLYNEIPGNCWGSPEKVKNWCEHFACKTSKTFAKITEREEQNHNVAVLQRLDPTLRMRS
jgi:hypothetical protein